MGPSARYKTLLCRFRGSRTRVPLCLGLALYCGAFAALRLITAPAIGVDADLEQLNAQGWALGYSHRQPPLYTWLLAAVQSVMGPTLASTLLLKYAALAGIIVCYAALATQLIGRRAGLLAAVSLLTLWQIGWNLHEGVTHTLMLTLMCVASALAWWRAIEGSRLSHYAVFGVALGFGLLSKFGFAAFAICLAAATILQPQARHRIRPSGMVLAALIALTLFAPYGVWLAAGPGDPAALFRATMGGAAGTPYATRMATGFISGVTAITGFLMPFLVVFLTVFPATLAPLPASRAARQPADGPDGLRLCRDTVLCGLGLMLIGVVFFGVGQFRERWLHPILILAPLWLVGRAACGFPSAARWRRYTIGLALIIGLMFTGRAATNIIAAPLCGACRPLIPYDTLIDRIAATGFSAGTIAAESSFTAANLRAAFPAARALALDRPEVPPPPQASGTGHCLLVWQSNSPSPPTKLLNHVGLAALPHTVETRHVIAPWPHPWRAEGWRTTRWRFVSFVPPKQARCPPWR